MESIYRMVLLLLLLLLVMAFLFVLLLLFHKYFLFQLDLSQLFLPLKLLRRCWASLLQRVSPSYPLR